MFPFGANIKDLQEQGATLLHHFSSHGDPDATDTLVLAKNFIAFLPFFKKRILPFWKKGNQGIPGEMNISKDDISANIKSLSVLDKHPDVILMVKEAKKHGCFPV